MAQMNNTVGQSPMPGPTYRQGTALGTYGENQLAIDEAKRQAGPNGYLDENQFRPMGPGGGVDNRVRASNASTAEQNYTRSLPGGQWSSDPYQRAQQQRNFHQTADFGKYWNALDPAARLQEKQGTEAYNFRTQLPELMASRRDQLTHEAGSALDSGLQNERAGMASRGLLNSGLRESDEGNMRARAANQLAGQMAGSNAELGKMADARDFAAAQSGLQAQREAQQAQQEVDDINMQNETRRAQQWQQLAGAGGYAAGRYFGSSGTSAPNAGNQSINSNNAQGYDPNSYLNRTA